MENLCWADRVRNEVLHRVKEDKNILHKIKREKANWVGNILLRNCLLKHIMEGKTEEIKYEEEDVSISWKTLKKREVTGIRKRKDQIALSERTPFGRLWTCRKTDLVVNELG